MAITSENKVKKLLPFRNTQFRYAITYVIITSIVLLFLNIYCSEISRDSFFESKESSMIERCKMVAGEISGLEALNENTIAEAVSEYEDLNVTRLIVTDQNMLVLYDTSTVSSVVGQYALFPEIVEALAGNDVFYSYYNNGVMRSTAAAPVYAYGSQIACAYIMERDTAQGTLIATLQNSIFMITFLLEIIVILFSFSFSNTYTRRLRKIMASIRTVRKGDYSHKLDMKGHDELNDLSNEFNDLISRLQTSEKKRSQFVSDASHELKTPLASIKLLTDSILQNNMDVDMTKEFVTDIGNEADRLNRMSQRLLTLSRIDDQPNRDYEIQYIAPTIERVIRMLNEQAKVNDVNIECDLSADCPILIYEDDLYQIIFNLVENGIKYNIRGGTLYLTLHRQTDNVVIKIRDTGVGIPEDSIDHIFERFYRVDKARSRSTGGSGLGLSIVRNMVDRNHGTIRVTSEVGKGTEFTLTFPIFETEEDAQ